MLLGAAGLWLFDIDGTLVAQSADQLDAWCAAFREAFGLEVAAAGVAPHLGQTFAEIVRRVLGPLGRTPAAAEIRRALSAYTRYVSEALALRPARLLPGAREVLEALRAQGRRVGVVSGNFPEEGEPKLASASLRGILDPVVYSNLDTPGREDLVRRALVLAQASGFPGGFEDTAVVGDSVHDIRSARATGARAVAVSTGVTPRDVLAAAGPDLVVPDLLALLGCLGTSWAPSTPAPGSA
jgi:phosphoglycolate phosphatase